MRDADAGRASEFEKDPVKLPGLIRQFRTGVVLWYYSNNTNAPKGAQKLRDEDGSGYPALWKDRTLVAYSVKGCKSKTWVLPPVWKTVQEAVVSEITTEGLKEIRTLKITVSSIILDMEPGQGLAIEAKNHR